MKDFTKLPVTVDNFPVNLKNESEVSKNNILSKANKK